MRKMLGMLTMVLAAAAASGCIQKETTHTLYLTPDGRVTWMVIEKDVRSDCDDAGRRHAEESSYLSAAPVNAHGVGAALASLRPGRLRTRILRGERPFLVMTEAEFGRIDVLSESMLAELRVLGDVRLVHDGPTSTLFVRIDTAGVAADDDSPESPIGGLAEALHRYRIVLTAGKFVEARGFSIIEGGTQAVPLEVSPEQIAANAGAIDLILSWQTP